MSSQQSKKKRWKCMVCGYIHEGGSPPKHCPKCGAPDEEFEELQPMEGIERNPVYDQLIKSDQNGGDN
ncbi:hypothetical protein HYS47_04875 [Candidatus Woesearchaeota archaeon]|nr:hypothetical protein [Candidatus Woesearchaeota archaeon]